MSLNKKLLIGVGIAHACSSAQTLMEQRESAYQFINENDALCDCIKCRLGKVDQCQTFSPSKKGKRK